MIDQLRSAARATARRGALAAAATLGLAAVCWVAAVRQMQGMDMGIATRLGSFAAFAAAWVLMMAAMMLPGAVPTVVRIARNRAAHAAPLFGATYLGVWAVVGGAIYATAGPHGTTAAAAVVIAAGLYELTPLKRHFRQQCQTRIDSGVRYGLCCVGSSIGLMLMFVALGVMSVTWMVVVAAVVVAQKLIRPRMAIDVALALAITGLGVLIVVAPPAIPGLMPSM